LSLHAHLKLKFDGYFVFKDALNIVGLLAAFGLIFAFPFVASDADNFLYANPLLSPAHIQPE